MEFATPGGNMSGDGELQMQVAEHVIQPTIGDRTQPSGFHWGVGAGVDRSGFACPAYFESSATSGIEPEAIGMK